MKGGLQFSKGTGMFLSFPGESGGSLVFQRRREDSKFSSREWSFPGFPGEKGGSQFSRGEGRFPSFPGESGGSLVFQGRVEVPQFSRGEGRFPVF